MAIIRKNLIGSVLLTDGQFLFAGDPVPSGTAVDPSLLEQDRPEPDPGADQADQTDQGGVQADPGSVDDAQGDPGSGRAPEVDDEDDILGTRKPAVEEKPARKRPSHSRKAV